MGWIAEQDRLPRTVEIVRKGIEDKLHLGVQLSVWHEGSTVADLAIGEARAGVPMTNDSIVPWLSCGKPIVAVAFAQLWEEGKLGLDDRVMRHIPEFGAGGKDEITIRHILTHTAGFRALETGYPQATWEQIIARICAMPIEPGWTPGKRGGYHVGTSWFILSEIIRRIDGRLIDAYVREQILVPLGMKDTWLAMPPDRFRADRGRLGVLYKRDASGALVDAMMDTDNRVTRPHPGGGFRGPARDLARFYRMLYRQGTLDDVTILQPPAVEALTARHRVGMMDQTFRHIVDYGLGFIINSNLWGIDTVPYGYGPHSGTRTFGHGGAQSSVGFCDPENDLIVAIIFNGMPGEPLHQARLRSTLGALYEDLAFRQGDEI